MHDVSKKEIKWNWIYKRSYVMRSIPELLFLCLNPILLSKLKGKRAGEVMSESDDDKFF